MYVINQKRRHHRENEFIGLNVRKFASDLSKTGSFRLFATITFQQVISLDEATDYGSLIWRRVQRDLMGRRRKKFNRIALSGVAVMERAFIHAGKFGGDSWHIHTLLEDHECFHRYDLAASMDISSRLFKTTKNLRAKDKRILVGGTGVDVRPVHDQQRICAYLSKQSWKSDWSWHDNVKVLHGDGLA
jgi:hypothetical protein